MIFEEVHDLLKEIFQCGVKKPVGINISYLPESNDGNTGISEGFRLLINNSDINEAAFNCIRMILQVRKLRFRWNTEKSNRILEIYSPSRSKSNFDNHI